MKKDYFHYIDSEEYKEYNEKVFKTMLSCNTIEHWISCIKLINLVETYQFKQARTEKDKCLILSNASFRRGFAYGMKQSLMEEQHKYGVQSYLELGC